jgi:hypothetical protein
MEAIAPLITSLEHSLERRDVQQSRALLVRAVKEYIPMPDGVDWVELHSSVSASEPEGVLSNASEV